MINEKSSTEDLIIIGELSIPLIATCEMINLRLLISDILFTISKIVYEHFSR